jgi:carbon-monoxide dehydrogenase large subunit
VRTIAPEVGGGFGKIGAYPEDVLAAYLARKLERPIKWIEGRTEHVQATVHGRFLSRSRRPPGRTYHRPAPAAIVDSGAYSASWLGQTTAGMVTGCYDIPNIESRPLPS